MALAAQGAWELIGNDRALGTGQVVDCIMNTIPVAKSLGYKKVG